MPESSSFRPSEARAGIQSSEELPFGFLASDFAASPATKCSCHLGEGAGLACPRRLIWMSEPPGCVQKPMDLFASWSGWGFAMVT